MMKVGLISEVSREQRGLRVHPRMRAAIQSLRYDDVHPHVLGHVAEFIAGIKPRAGMLAKIDVVLVASDDAARVIDRLRQVDDSIPIVASVQDLHPSLWPTLVKAGVTAIVPPEGRVTDYLFAAFAYHDEKKSGTVRTLPDMHQRTRRLLEFLLEHQGEPVSLDQVKTELAVWTPRTVRKYLDELETVCKTMGWSLSTGRASHRHGRPRCVKLQT